MRNSPIESGSTPPERDLVDRLDALFERIAVWSFDHRLVVLALSIGLLAGGAWLASLVRFDNSLAAWFDRSDPAFVAYLDFRDEFGSDEVAYIVYEAPGVEHGPWNLDVMRRIETLTAALEAEVPFVREVKSLTNAELMVPVPDGLEIVTIEDDFPDTQAQLLERRERFLSKPFLVGGLLSEDGRYAAVSVEMEGSSIDPIEALRLDPDGGNALDNLYPQASYHPIEAILARPEYDGIVFHHTGDVALNATMNTITAEEAVTLGGLCFAVVGVILALFFRSPLGVLGPLAVVFLSIMLSVSVIGLLGFELGFMFTMVPTLLIAVGVADGVHIVAEFRALAAELGSRRKALERTMALVATPCLLTSVTTAAGFSAMTIAPIKAISEFGVYAAAGILAAFVLSVSVLPVCLSFGRSFGDPKVLAARSKGGRRTVAALVSVARFAVRQRRAILVVSALLTVVSIAGALQLTVDSNFLDDFSDQVPVRRATLLADEVMGGSASIVYVFDSHETEGVKNPAVLREIERVSEIALENPQLVRKTYSAATVLRDINKTFHDDDPDFDVIPDQRDLVGQYLLLYELSGGQEIEEFLSGDFSRAVLEVRIAIVASSRMAELADRVEAALAVEPLEATTVQQTGMASLWIRLMDYITTSQINGFLLAFGAISVALCLVFRSVPIGLVAMIPNLAPVLLTLGGMGWTGVPLDYVRLLIAPVAIGIAVDDTIHHITRFRYEFRRLGNYEEALVASMAGVGRALVITSVVLVCGFLVFTFSVLDAQVSFGLLLATTIVIALAADFLLMPALVLTLEPFGPETAPQESGDPT